MSSKSARLRTWLAHPMARGMDIDSPQTTEVRRTIIHEKPFLNSIYLDWYRRIASSLPEGDGPVLEVGSGGGFMREVVSQIITSDVMTLLGIDLVLEAHSLPFPDATLRGIAM